MDPHLKDIMGPVPFTLKPPVMVRYVFFRMRSEGFSFLLFPEKLFFPWFELVVLLKLLILHHQHACKEPA